MSEIHGTAVIHDGARVGEGVTVGPYCVVGPDVTLGNGVELKAHVVAEGCTAIGEGCTLFPFACVGTLTQDLKYRGAHTRVEIGAHTTLREYVTVNSGTEEGEVVSVGSGCHIMAYAHIAHGCRIGDGVIMANAANLSGHIVVEDGAIIGGLTGIHQFVRVGTMCMVGGLSRVTQDCPPYMTVVGNPCRVTGVNAVGLRRRGLAADVRRRLKQAHRILFREGLAMGRALERLKTEIEPCAEIERLAAFIAASERGVCRGRGGPADEDAES
jgi:UDP-N-acetylglucosamine acyltransferase